MLRGLSPKIGQEVMVVPEHPHSCHLLYMGVGLGPSDTKNLIMCKSPVQNSTVLVYGCVLPVYSVSSLSIQSVIK